MHFKGFHDCRPVKLGGYYERGLLGQDSEFLCNVFREIFSDVPKEDVDCVIQHSPAAAIGSVARCGSWEATNIS